MIHNEFDMETVMESYKNMCKQLLKLYVQLVGHLMVLF